MDVCIYLAGGNRRSIGRANELVALVERDRELLAAVVREMWNDDPIVAMRAADAAEKLTRARPEVLQGFKPELLGLAEETSQQELRWHLAAMVPRLRLKPAEKHRAVQTLTRYLEDKSSIVKTFAMQGLFDLSCGDKALRGKVEEMLRAVLNRGTPAMRARARKLLKQTERSHPKTRKRSLSTDVSLLLFSI